MRSSLAISGVALALALAPAAMWAQSAPQAPPAQAQNPPAQNPPAQNPPAQPASPAPRTFSADAGMMFNQIKPDHTADFELVMSRLKQALMKSPDASRRQQAASWKVFKAIESGPNANSVLYIFVMDPPVKGADYTVSKILAEAFPSEVQDLYKKYSESYVGASMINLQLIQNMASAPAVPAAGGK